MFKESQQGSLTTSIAESAGRALLSGKLIQTTYTEPQPRLAAVQGIPMHSPVQQPKLEQQPLLYH